MRCPSLILPILLLVSPVVCPAQNTTGGIAGTVKNKAGIVLRGATIKLLHAFSGVSYMTHTDKNGWFAIVNVLPGGPYTIEASTAGYSAANKQSILIQLGEPVLIDLVLTEKEIYLGNVTVTSGRRNGNDAITFMNAERMATLPSTGHNLHDHLKYVPQAKLIAGNEGAVSIAGQNNRFNSFYVDGAASNDVFGLTASGTNGGQAGVSPLPADAIEQLQVMVSPFDVSMGNFTGAGINAVTRSGTNKRESSVYCFFSNSMLTGRTPVTDKDEAVKTAGFMKRTLGMRMQGPIVKDRSFYFINIDLQHTESPQFFDPEGYTGDTHDPALLSILANTLKGTYHYDPGSYADNPEVRNAVRMVARFDWTAGNKHKMMFSYRHTDGGRENTNGSTAGIIHFSNDGYHLQTSIRSVSFELKSIIAGNAGNRFMITYTYVGDERKPLAVAFPKVRINDGEGAIIFGTDGNSAVNRLKQNSLTITDKMSYTIGKQTFNAGVDCEYTGIENAFIQNAFGSYTFSSLENFLRNERPSYYQLGYAVHNTDNYDDNRAAAKFAMARLSCFLSDKIRVTGSLTLNAGIRTDGFFFPGRSHYDDHLNTDVLPILSKYHDLQGAVAGKKLTIPVSFSPRFGFTWMPRDKKITIHGGTGIFNGRIPLAWPANAYLNNGHSIGGYIAAPAQLNRMRFRADPFSPWLPSELGAKDNNIPFDLLAAGLRLPAVVRSLLGVNWSRNGWLFASELMLSRNLTEIAYINSNILTPAGRAIGPDSRSVYTVQGEGRIPLLADGSNPYSHAIVLTNYKGNKGSAFNYTLSINRRTDDLQLETAYNFCSSFAVNDGTSSVNLSQWRFMETVNGRNDISLSRSDFSSGHRLLLVITKTFSVRKDLANTVSLSYTGESGQPFSYVYGNAGMVRDDGTLGGNDLIYIPTSGQLAGMQFIPFTNAAGLMVGTDRQKAGFEQYIAGDSYLRRHRGEYAGRNTSRTPFTHVIDLKIKFEWKLMYGGVRYRCQLTFDLYNAGNLLNRNWGLRYLQPGDNFKLISFMGYQSENALLPRYQFDPAVLKSSTYIINNSFEPAYSARWMGQIGIRLIF